MYLVDTNVISELRKNKPHGGVVSWMNSVPADGIFLSALSLGELQAGIESTRRQDATKAEQIEAWLDQIANSYQVLPMDGRIFREWARLMHGQPEPLLEDAMIAATARVYRLTVVTRNIRDFKAFNVTLLDPFAAR